MLNWLLHPPRQAALLCGFAFGLPPFLVGVAVLVHDGRGLAAALSVLAVALALWVVSDMNYQLSKSEPKPRATPPEW